MNEIAQLEGKVAIVIGAANRIGSAIADLFSNEGALLVLPDRSVQGLDQTRVKCGNAAHVTHTVDVREDNDIASVYEDVVARYGGIDILIKSAGILNETRFTEISP